MCDVEILTHVWHYSRSLAYQISGLILDPPKCSVQLTVYTNAEDEGTIKVIQTLYKNLPPNVNIQPRMLDKPKLFRRAIGRNEACLGTLAKACVVMTDADYVYTGTALDEILSNGLSDETAFTFPHHYWKQKTHELGDAYLARQDPPQVLGLDPADFESCRIGKAIGGLMIYRADTARELGYLNGTKWLTPHNGPRFGCCRCDRGFRVWLADKGHVSKDFDGGMPWRIRHSVKGRCEEVEN